MTSAGIAQLALVLLLATAFGELACRLRLPRLVGELAVGVMLGPSLLGTLVPGFAARVVPGPPGQFLLVEGVATLGVLLLVGVTGVHLDLAMLSRHRRAVGWISLAGLTIPLALGVAAGYALPSSVIGDPQRRDLFAGFLGVALSVSAIPVIAKTLLDLDLIHRDVGQLTLAAAAVDDTLGWLLLSMLAAVAGTGSVAGSLGSAALAVLALLCAGGLLTSRYLRPLLLRAAGGREAGRGIAVVVVIILLGAGLAQSLGLEAAFGALIAGSAVGLAGNSDSRWLNPLRSFVHGVLAPIFFATVGLRMDLPALADPVILAATVLLLAVAIAGKFLGGYLGARAGGLGRWEGLSVGAGINARGVIQMIVALVGLRLGILNTASYTMIVVVAIVTSVMAPPVLRYGLSRVTITPQERARQALS